MQSYCAIDCGFLDFKDNNFAQCQGGHSKENWNEEISKTCNPLPSYFPSTFPPPNFEQIIGWLLQLSYIAQSL